MKKKILVIGASVIFSVLILMQASAVYAAPVYIAGLADFHAYPYNNAPYGGVYVGCGPTTGAMILGYFEHHFGAAGLLTNPVAGTDEGLATAWSLHSQNYMKTGDDGFGAPAYVKPGMEDYAEDRGYQIKVMAHFGTDKSPTDPTIIGTYGAYGDGWTNDADFWIVTGGIDADKFCDFVTTKLSAGICIWLSVDPGTGGADHWVPCVGCDKDTDKYYFYDTYNLPIQNSAIIEVGSAGAGKWAIGFLRSVTYIGAIQPPTAVSIESCDSMGTKKDTFQPDDEVYATGTGYSASTTYDVYLVEDVTWVNDMLIPPRVPGTTTSVSSDATGAVPATLLWGDPTHTPGKYDIVVDVNDNGKYDAATDALDDNDIVTTAGFLVIPELEILLLLGGCFAAFGAYWMFKQKHP